MRPGKQLFWLERWPATGEAEVNFTDAAHPTRNTRATHMWTQTSEEQPLLTVNGRERDKLDATRTAHSPTLP